MKVASLLVPVVLATSVCAPPAEADAPQAAPLVAEYLPAGSLSVSPDVRLRLARDAASRTTERIEGFPLDRGRTVSLELEPFEVWGPDVVILEHGVNGTRRLPMPMDRYYRGSIAEEPGSLVFLAAGKTLRGLILSGEDVFTIAPSGSAWGDGPGSGEAFVRRVDVQRERPEGMGDFFCGEESLVTPRFTGFTSVSTTQGVEPLYTSTVYVATVAVETDHELYVKLGSSSSALTSYVGDLVAASSAIYQRDIQVKKQVGTLHIYSGGASSDPWTQSSPDLALFELGDYWHANYPLATNPRSTVHLLSGKSGGGGIAWRGSICMSDFLCGPSNCGSSSANGHYAGAYGVSTSLNGQFSATNPSLYWDLLCFSHEVGHNFNSRHTHCYTPPVDTCCPCEPASALDCTGPVPAEKGTIMSYCHLRPPGYSNVKLYLAVPAESSVAVYNVMRTFVEGLTCLPVDSGPAPTVASVSPPQGSTVGGTSVSITGTNFVSGATVGFGGSAATGVVVGSATSITAVTPAHASGFVNVVVTNPDLKSGTLTNGYRFLAPPPTVTAVSPNSGSTSGGTGVTITGTGFAATPTVQLGGTSATGVTFVSATTLSATTPAHSAGLVSVAVTNPDAQSGTLANGFFYAAAPSATRYYVLTPCRLFDTRNASGAAAAAPILAAGETRTFDLSGRCGVPEAAVALTVNVTVTGSGAAGELRLFPANGVSPNPATTAISFAAGKTRANNGSYLLSTDGTLAYKVQNVSSAGVHFILDVSGYYLLAP